MADEIKRKMSLMSVIDLTGDSDEERSMKVTQAPKPKMTSFEANIKGAFTKKAEGKGGQSAKPKNKYEDDAATSYYVSDPDLPSDLEPYERSDYERAVEESKLAANSLSDNQENIDDTSDIVEIAKMEAIGETQTNIFCCKGADGKLEYSPRKTAAYLPEEKHADIHEFVEAVNAGNAKYAIGSLTPEELKKVTLVVKVNTRDGFEDTATTLFCLTAEFAADAEHKYTAFARLDKPQSFEPAGEQAYLAFSCSLHKKDVRVGVHRIKWTTKRTWARWENGALDDLMGHPKRPVYNFGQPPLGFGGM